MHHAAIHADTAVLCEKIIDWHLTHFRHNRLSLIRFGGGDGFQVVHRRGIVAGVTHMRHALHSIEKPLRPAARILVPIPIEGVGKNKPLGSFPPPTSHVCDPYEKTSERLTALPDPEFLSRFDCIDEDRARTGKPHHFSP